MIKTKIIEYAQNALIVRSHMHPIHPNDLSGPHVTHIYSKYTGNIPSRMIHYVANSTPFKLLDATVVEYKEFDSPVTAIIDIEYDDDVEATGEENMQVAQDAVVIGTI